MKIESIKKEFLKAVEKIQSKEEIEALKVKYLNKGGVLQQLFSKIKDLPSEERKSFGQKVNELKNLITQKLEQAKKELIEELLLKEDSKKDIDLNAPFAVNAKEKPSFFSNRGNLHPLTLEIENMLSIFRRMGFNLIEGRELDSDYYMFESLGLPKDHPAREMWDTFYTEEGYIPSAHTSTMQVRVMRKYKQPPIHAVVYSKCFRNEAVDAVHGYTMYQIEGLYIDKGVTVSNMVATIKTYIEAFFNRSVIWRIQPAYFPFVEPGLEFMIQCVFCGGRGCPSCKYSGWLEVLGAGMIHPTVLRNGGIDPEKYSGFAWGLGLDRMVMNKNNIRDIRNLQGKDLRLFKER